MRQSCVLKRRVEEEERTQRGNGGSGRRHGAKRARMRKTWSGRVACEVVTMRVQGVSTLQWWSGKEDTRAVEGEDGRRP